MSVNGVARQLPAGTTLGSLLASRGLRAADGRLLSVSGAVLDPRWDPGQVLLDGRPAPMSRRLRNGESVQVVDGRDHTEGRRRIVTAPAGRSPPNPQRTLTTYRVREVTVEGRISGEIVSVTELPVGAGHVPRAVALTFDDGPWPGDTARVLAVLDRLHVPATFFMIGRQVRSYPGLVKQVVAAGHEIGNHSYDHPIHPPLAELSNARIAAEMSDATTVLSAVGVAPTLFRPPGGSYDAAVVREARAQGMRVVLWSVDPQDWRSGRRWKAIARRVLANVRPGSIVLLHDGGGDAPHTIRALPRIIRGIRRRGLRLVALSP